MELPIHNYGDPVLRQKAEPIEDVNDEVRALAEDMIQTMHAARGVGLAAQQIGRTIAICIVEVPEELDVDDDGERLNPQVAMPLILVNPKITFYSRETESGEEGCLSFPEIVGPIPRSLEVDVSCLDEHGAARELHLKGFAARVVQHEVDHLNGVLFIDRMSAVKRITLKGRLKRMRKETEQRLGLA
jgi:peptide deformylase